MSDLDDDNADEGVEGDVDGANEVWRDWCQRHLCSAQFTDTTHQKFTWHTAHQNSLDTLPWRQLAMMKMTQNLKRKNGKDAVYHNLHPDGRKFSLSERKLRVQACSKRVVSEKETINTVVNIHNEVFYSFNEKDCFAENLCAWTKHGELSHVHLVRLQK